MAPHSSTRRSPDRGARAAAGARRGGCECADREPLDGGEAMDLAERSEPVARCAAAAGRDSSGFCGDAAGRRAARTGVASLNACDLSALLRAELPRRRLLPVSPFRPRPVSAGPYVGLLHFFAVADTRPP